MHQTRKLAYAHDDDDGDDGDDDDDVDKTTFAIYITPALIALILPHMGRIRNVCLEVRQL